jgi:hypothetical protein
MPCRDSRDDEDNAHMREGGELLCDFVRGLELAGFKVPARWSKWWERHKARDSAQP